MRLTKTAYTCPIKLMIGNRKISKLCKISQETKFKADSTKEKWETEMAIAVTKEGWEDDL